jgi:hypothetical protein
MLLKDALELITRLIRTGEKHKDYSHVVELAETYRIFITGKNIEKKLIRYVRREDADLFAQRVQLTQPITPAVSSSIRQPFNKVTRNDRIRKAINLKTEARKPTVEKMAAGFYGASRRKNKGLDYWLKTRFTEMVFIDPNSWTVVEWDTPQNLRDVVTPRPFEVSAQMAHNFFIANDEVKWLFVCQDIKYMSTKPAGTGGTGTTNNGVIGTGNNTEGNYFKLDGNRWTLYDTDNTIVFEQVDPEYLKATGYEMQPGEALLSVKETPYLVRSFQPKVGYVPAFRNGYKRDEETDGRTFVNPWHDALCYFNKSLKTVSELDLTFTLHAFPQKLQYVQKCTGSRNSEGIKKGCSDGIVQGTMNQVCPSCKGNGWKVHTSAQDAIFLPMPDDAKDMINLDEILVYKAPPVDLIKLQNEYTLQLEKQAHQAVFNSQVFVTKAGGGITEQKTATEADFNMQSVYDALEPFTEKYSEMWREFITIFAVIAGEPVEAVEVSHEFPADYKLKTGDILLGERKAAKDSGAPAFLVETIDDDLATIIYAGDALGLQKYRVKRRYYPFTGKNEDEVALLLASEYVPNEFKILFSNFELIFRELEQENPAFWTMTDLKKQREMVTAKVTEWADRIDQATPAATIDTFRQNRPTDQNNGGDGNQGNPGDNTNNNPDNQNTP